MKIRSPYLVFSMACLGVALFVMVAPWKDWAAALIKRSLARQGLADIEFTVDRLSVDGITFANLKIPQQKDTFIKQVTLGYSLLDLVQGQLRQIEVTNITAHIGDKEISLRKGRIDLQTTDIMNTWEGTWIAEGLEIQTLPVLVPPLTGDGIFNISATKLYAKGDLKSDDGKFQAALQANYFLKGVNTQSQADIFYVEFPWSGGTIFVRNGAYQFAGRERFKGNIEVRAVKVNALLQELTSGKANGTGTVSGRIPLVIDDEGTPIIRNANLTSDKNGRIHIAEDAIPDSNEQMGVLKGVLSNFHYNVLSITLGTDENRKLFARLRVEGRNPTMYNGKPVKLNVQLSGDVLALLKQSAPALSDPSQLIKQGGYVKP